MTAAGPGGDLLAHGVGSRQDLPIPFSYALAGAGIAVVVSFVALGVLWRTPRLGRPDVGRPVPAALAGIIDAPGVRTGLRALGLVLAGYFLIGLLLGPDLATNPSARVVYVLFWVGIVPLSLAFGPAWRLLNPLRTLHLLLSRLLRADPHLGLTPLPSWVGYWPAAAGLLAFVWLELIPDGRASLPVLRAWLAVYCAVQILAASVFGSGWFDRGDAFEAWSSLVGRFAVLGRRPRDARLVWRNPLDGIASLPTAPGLVAVACVMLGSTAFDSVSNAPFWFRFAQAGPLEPSVAGTLGLLSVIAAVAVLYSAATLSSAAAGHVRRHRLPGEFAHTLVPIAIGYVVAHYYSLLILEGMRGLTELSDPLVTGHSNWLGTRDLGTASLLVAPTPVATIQVLAVVVGHVVAVVLAHDRAVRLFPRRQAVQGQLPLLVLMVAYTVGGLTLLFAT